MPNSLNSQSPGDYIVPLVMNGLRGRMLHLPASGKRNRHILLVYGHHSTLELYWHLAQELSRYGDVTVPDLPGFGGMQNFYKIGSKPTVDNLADYLAAFVKLRYKRRRITIAAANFGFVVVTRMLQKYPDLAAKTDLLISLGGYAHRDDFQLSAAKRTLYHRIAVALSWRWPSHFFRNVCLHPWALRWFYARTGIGRQKIDGLDEAHKKEVIKTAIHLWHRNDARTYLRTLADSLQIDNCHAQAKLPLMHIAYAEDKLLDRFRVEQHLKVIFKTVTEALVPVDTRRASVLLDRNQTAKLLPRRVRSALNRT